MAKSTLVISRQPALGGPAPREALDIVLAGGAFELPLAMLFDAIYAEAAALQRLGITPEQLPGWVTPLEPEALATLIHDHDQVISI